MELKPRLPVRRPRDEAEANGIQGLSPPATHLLILLDVNGDTIRLARTSS
jgi:hypothetical protein